MYLRPRCFYTDVQMFCRRELLTGLSLGMPEHGGFWCTAWLHGTKQA